MMDYKTFKKTKEVRILPSGFAVDEAALNPAAFDWQRMVVAQSLKRGKAALFEDCGLGKTLQQLMWAQEVSRYNNKPVLIVAPLPPSSSRHTSPKWRPTVKKFATQVIS